MRLDRTITLNIANSLRRTAPSRPTESLGEKIPVLMYHSISVDAEHGISPYYRLNTHPNIFRRHMSLLKEWGYVGITLDEALKSLGGEQTLEGRAPVVITFDDGFQDFYTAAFPVLQEFGFSATMFLPTSFIANSRRAFRPKGGSDLDSNRSGDRNCLTWQEIHEMSRYGVEFGSHTVTHPKLYDLTWAEIESELSNSKSQIEDQIGCAVTTFGYPYAFPEGDVKFVKELGCALRSAGYAAAATTRVGRLTREGDRFFVPRLPVNSCDDDLLFAAKLNGAYDWVGRLQYFRKKLRSSRSQRPNDARETAVVS